MATDCLALLALPPQDALKQVVQDVLVSGKSVEDLALTSPKAGQGLSMTVNAIPAPDRSQDPDWVYYGSVPVQYNRLDLADTFSGLQLAFKVPLPCTTADVVAKLAAAFNMQFEAADFVQETVNTPPAQPYSLRAAPTSTRWSGMVSIVLYKDYTLVNQGV